MALVEAHEELPAWSLPAEAVEGISLSADWPERVDREWAWGGSTGANVRVCILDSGVESGHPLVGDLEGAVAISFGEDGDPIVEEDSEGDLCGHGTACAGIVRALAPECSLFSVRVLGAGYTGSGPVLLAGLRWAVEQGFEVVNMSLSTTKQELAVLLHELAHELERRCEALEEAIAKLGWVRNESARQLRAGRSRSIGMVVMDVANPFFTDIVSGVEDYVHNLGYSVQLGNSAQQTEREAAHLKLFEQHRVRGLLFAPISEVGQRVVEMRGHGIPVVIVDRAAKDAPYCSVAVDDVEGGRLAVGHLVAQGHRKIAFVGGPVSIQQVRDRHPGHARVPRRGQDR